VLSRSQSQIQSQRHTQIQSQIKIKAKKGAKWNSKCLGLKMELNSPNKMLTQGPILYSLGLGHYIYPYLSL